MSTEVEIVEVAPRDGLQNEPVVVSTADKLRLIEQALAAGLRRIEAASFVNPKRVPQMADADSVMAGVPRREGVRYSGLALNRRGAERALAAGVDEINYVVIATDSYNVANQGCRTAETLSAWPEVAALALSAGKTATFTVAATFGCPFEGEVPAGEVAALAREAARCGASTLILADSIGVAAPTDVTRKIAVVREAVPNIRLRCHFHNTRNTALANICAAMEAGVREFDASIGGIGGCPFAPGATGNVATEDVVYMLGRMGVKTGVDLDRTIRTAEWLSDVLGHPLPGMLCRAGPFPADASRSSRVELVSDHVPSGVAHL